jgi:hypothetical protein
MIMDNQTRKNDPAIQAPSSVDPAYQEKIEAAKAAREQGKQMRKGRPIAFSSRRSLANP